MNIVHLGPSWIFVNLIYQVRNYPQQKVSGQACEIVLWLMIDVCVCVGGGRSLQVMLHLGRWS